jgi:hypothetical protein
MTEIQINPITEDWSRASIVAYRDGLIESGDFGESEVDRRLLMDLIGHEGTRQDIINDAALHLFRNEFNLVTNYYQMYEIFKDETDLITSNEHHESLVKMLTFLRDIVSGNSPLNFEALSSILDDIFRTVPEVDYRINTEMPAHFIIHMLEMANNIYKMHHNGNKVSKASISTEGVQGNRVLTVENEGGIAWDEVRFNKGASFFPGYSDRTSEGLTEQNGANGGNGLGYIARDTLVAGGRVNLYREFGDQRREWSISLTDDYLTTDVIETDNDFVELDTGLYVGFNNSRGIFYARNLENGEFAYYAPKCVEITRKANNTPVSRITLSIPSDSMQSAA